MPLKQLTLSDEQVQDIVASLITGGGGSDVAYDDINDTLTVSLSDSISVNTLEATSTINTADISTASQGDALVKSASGTDLTFDQAGISLPDLVRTNGWWFQTVFQSIDGWLRGSGGSGSVSLRDEAVTVNSGGTDGSNAKIRKLIQYPVRQLDWSKDRSFAVGLEILSINGELAVGSGKLDSFGSTDRHIHFKVANGDLVGSVADGSTEATTTLISNVSTGVKQLQYEFTSGSEVEFFVDGSSKGVISSNLPTGTAKADQITAFVDNNSANFTIIKISEIRLVQHP